MHWWRSKRTGAKRERKHTGIRREKWGYGNKQCAFPSLLIHASLSHLPFIPASPSLCSWLFILKGCSVWVCVERLVTSPRLLPFSLPLLNYPWLPLANYHQILESEIHTYAPTHILLFSTAEPLAVKDLRHHRTAKKEKKKKERYLGTSSRCLYSTVKTSLAIIYIFFLSSLNSR